ncbi:hypothetical protein ALC62_04966 [Cyphomyrmex costatus]|uniref:Uncharacterized protein n=1 Tax=Cyphomyrmex costatus TaxID=456900 RepID=A0A195CU30_9HYME|nr:hypothetical protein ALC62_04966 [Cyphomyrmex costatus]
MNLRDRHASKERRQISVFRHWRSSQFASLKSCICISEHPPFSLIIAIEYSVNDASFVGPDGRRVGGEEGKKKDEDGRKGMEVAVMHEEEEDEEVDEARRRGRKSNAGFTTARHPSTRQMCFTIWRQNADDDDGGGDGDDDSSSSFVKPFSRLNDHEVEARRKKKARRAVYLDIWSCGSRMMGNSDETNDVSVSRRGRIEELKEIRVSKERGDGKGSDGKKERKGEGGKVEKDGRQPTGPFKVPRRQQRASNELIKLSNSFGLASERANKCSPLPRGPLQCSRAPSVEL